MDYIEAENLVKKIEKMVESEGVDHYAKTVKREGNSRYLELTVSIKIK